MDIKYEEKFKFGNINDGGKNKFGNIKDEEKNKFGNIKDGEKKIREYKRCREK